MQNQIVNLTARLYTYRDLAGCSFLDNYRTTPIPKYTLKVPTLSASKTTTKKGRASLLPYSLIKCAKGYHRHQIINKIGQIQINIKF